VTLVHRPGERAAAILAALFILAHGAPEAFADVGQPPPAAAVSSSASDPSSTPAPAAAHPVLFDLGAGTYFPTSIGAEATLELPYRILVQSDLGWMPSAYSSAIVGFMGDVGALSATEQNLLNLAIQNSLVFRLAAGWRPFPRLGLEVTIGYTLVSIGGGVSGTDVIQAYLESKGSADQVPADASRQVPLNATLHNFQGTVGWRFLFFEDKLVLRASLSYLECFASSTGISVSTPRPIEQAAINKINSDLQGYLGPYFTEYVKIPVVGVTAAYRF
jgi:hypothetical protein